jgi:serine protease Do
MLRKSLIALILATFFAFLVIWKIPVKAEEKSISVRVESAKVKIPPNPEKHWRSPKEGWLGVYVQDINRALKETMDLKSEKGVLIRDVVEDSPAEKAGIEREDVILAFDGKKVTDTEQFLMMVKKTSPGDEVELLIVRDGKEKTLTITLGEAPESKLREQEIPKFIPPNVKPPKINPQIHKFSSFSGVRIGVKVEDLSQQLGDYFGVKDGEGALITEVDEDGPADKAGLKAGDVVVKVDEKTIEDTEDLVSAISEKEEGDKVEIRVIRNHTPQSFTVKVEKGEGLSSVYLKEFEKLERLPEEFQEPRAIWKEKTIRPPSGGLREELDQLKEQIQELKEELENLKEQLR